MLSRGHIFKSHFWALLSLSLDIPQGHQLHMRFCSQAVASVKDTSPPPLPQPPCQLPSAREPNSDLDLWCACMSCAICLYAPYVDCFSLPRSLFVGFYVCFNAVLHNYSLYSHRGLLVSKNSTNILSCNLPAACEAGKTGVVMGDVLQMSSLGLREAKVTSCEEAGLGLDPGLLGPCSQPFPRCHPAWNPVGRVSSVVPRIIR